MVENQNEVDFAADFMREYAQLKNEAASAAQQMSRALLRADNFIATGDYIAMAGTALDADMSARRAEAETVAAAAWGTGLGDTTREEYEELINPPPE